MGEGSASGKMLFPRALRRAAPHRWNVVPFRTFQRCVPPRHYRPQVSLRSRTLPKRHASVAAETAAEGSQWVALTSETGRKAVGYWLLGSCGVVFSMVLLGGVTRLTHSGLSMVEWKPQVLSPPMNEEEWEVEFAKYRQFPEFYKLHPDMTMEEFKPIYWFEYSHHMLGRALGVLFAV